MRKHIIAAGSVMTVLCLLFGISGCLKDSCRNTYKIYTPVFRKLTDVRAEMRSRPPVALKETGKIYVYGNFVLVNELQKGIHIIDNTNPAAPRNLSFIPVPGNVDIAVRGDFLYADCYSDIVVFDISNPMAVQPVRFLDNALPENQSLWGNAGSADSVNVIVDYIIRDTTVDCDTWSRWGSCANCLFADAGGRPSLANAAPVKSGTGGSMARFTIANDFLYGVTPQKLYTFSLANAAAPQRTSVLNMGWGIETVYPFGNKLFIGSNTGMFIYDITNPANPVQQGLFTHATACDPVVTDGTHAYITLRSGQACTRASNQLDVIDVTTMASPRLLRTYPMTNPHGLAKDGNALFVCDGRDGLRVLNAADPGNMTLVKRLEGAETYDVIARNGLAIVVAKDGLYQYDYSNLTNIRLLSKLPVVKF